MSQSYEDMTEQCPRCHAAAGAPCLNPLTKEPAHMCCVSRLKRVSV